MHEASSFNMEKQTRILFGFEIWKTHAPERKAWRVELFRQKLESKKSENQSQTNAKILEFLIMWKGRQEIHEWVKLWLKCDITTLYTLKFSEVLWNCAVQ